MIHNTDEQQSAAAEEESAIPQITGKLQLGHWIGAGTVGAVYSATYNSQRVALKKFFEKPTRSQVFHREVSLLASAAHPNIVNLIAVDYKRLYVMTELAAHGSLQEALKAGPLPEARRVLHDVAVAM